MTQVGTEGLPMFEAEHAARATDPATSHKAAARVAPRVGSQQWRILSVLRLRPMTADEIDAELQWRPTTAGRRLPELEGVGLVALVLVQDAGDPHPWELERRTSSGALARVYELTDRGRSLLAGAR